MARLSILFVLALLVADVTGQTSQPPIVSVLDFGSSVLAKQAADTLRSRFRASGDVRVEDADLSRSAAKGIGYSGSLNLTVAEARDLGAAMATEFYVLGDAQTLRRSSSQLPIYYESYCSLFVVSARTGRLLSWERPSFENLEATIAESQLSQYLADDALTRRVIALIKTINEAERKQRIAPPAPVETLIAEAPDDEKAAEVNGIRLPRPFRRLKPEYPQTAAKAEAEATVDVAVEVGADGEIGEVQIVRWGGFGLDEATAATVHQLHFFPAMKNGTPIPMRVLLRYNFRKPPR